MSLLLTLVRHAKSDWSDPQCPDYDRPLNARGRRDCPRMAAWLRANQVAPSRWMISGARRTRDTAAALLATLVADLPAGQRPVELFDDRLYHAGPGALLAAIRETPADCPWVMLVGHNPGLTALANLLAPTSVHADLPTLAVVTFECPQALWSDMDYGRAALRSLMTPKQLPDAP